MALKKLIDVIKTVISPVQFDIILIISYQLLQLCYHIYVQYTIAIYNYISCNIMNHNFFFIKQLIHCLDQDLWNKWRIVCYAAIIIGFQNR